PSPPAPWRAALAAFAVVGLLGGVLIFRQSSARRAPGAFVIWEGCLDEPLPARINSLMTVYWPEFRGDRRRGQPGAERTDEFKVGKWTYRAELERRWLSDA